MGTEEQLVAAADDACDDLETIRGIGSKWAAALHRTGIRRFEDLAQYTPHSLAKALFDQTGVKVPPERIEAKQWIGQARELAQHANPGRTPANEETEGAKDPPHASPRRKWEQHAAFSVFFDYEIDEHGERMWQTRVYDNESGVEEPLPGIEPTPWVNWILERAKLPVSAEPVPTPIEAAAPPTPMTLYDAQIEILDVRVSALGPSPDVPEKRLATEVRFQVSGPEAERLAADRIPFRIEVHTVDLKSGASVLVASEGGKLEPQVFEYTSQQEFPLPELGRYELHAVILLLLPGEMMASHQGPTLKVVP
jgi:hypothetical protein